LKKILLGKGEAAALTGILLDSGIVAEISPAFQAIVRHSRACASILESEGGPEQIKIRFPVTFHGINTGPAHEHIRADRSTAFEKEVSCKRSREIDQSQYGYNKAGHSKESNLLSPCNDLKNARRYST
jgi:hypothetical protein